MKGIDYELGSDGIVVLTIDSPGQQTNTMNHEFREAFAQTCTKLKQQQDELQGIILTSAKKSFFAGGDLNELLQVTAAQHEAFRQIVASLRANLRQLETLGVPVVAALAGSALGGGWELALACHYRVCLNRSDIRLGLPEVALGLMPGAGGICRTVRLLGLERSLPLLLEGSQLNPEKAHQYGLIDELVNSEEALLDSARTWIQEQDGATQPWDRKGYHLPGGTPRDPKLAAWLSIAPAKLRQRSWGCYLAPERILAAAVEGALLDFQGAEQVELVYFTELVISQTSKNMIQTLWFDHNKIRKGMARPDLPGSAPVQVVGVIGAGMMGSGIAYAAAMQGVGVILKDVSQDRAERGKEYTSRILRRRVKQGKMTVDEQEQVLERIVATTDAELFSACDLVVEAVYEQRGLKADVIREAEAQLKAEAIMASNTSTLPITGLAEASSRPEQFIGLHFFSPVERMPLVEIICGEKTSDETLARAFDFALQLNKTPIVVNDSRAFFTSRVFTSYIYEGIGMLAEGVAAAMIETEARKAGMAVGPLAVSDEVSLSLLAHVQAQTDEDYLQAGLPLPEHRAHSVIHRMLNEFKRAGRASSHGFYDYPDKAEKQLWSGLNNHFLQLDHAIPKADVRDRLLFIQVLESVRCFEEGVLRSAAEANIGSILGFGFPPATGGVLQFVNQYGGEQFVARAEQLTELYGERFAVSDLLREKVKNGLLLTD